MSRRAPKPVIERARSPFVWHRWVGLICAPFLLLLVLSGAALNHGEALRLDQRYLQSPWLLAHLGVRSEGPLQGLKLSGGWLVAHQERLYLDAERLATLSSPLLDAAQHAELIAALTGNGLLLLNIDGLLLEQLRRSELPVAPQKIGFTADGRLLLRGRDQSLISEDLGLSWTTHAGAMSVGAAPAQLPPALAAQIHRDAVRDRLSWSHFISELHSARIFGALGPWLLDLIGLLLLGLAGSGPWMWWRQRRAQRRREQIRSQHDPAV